MELEEIKRLKQQAEIEISDIVRNLERETGVKFHSFNTIEVESKCGGDYIFIVNLKI